MKFDKKPLSCETARDLMFDHLDGELSNDVTEQLKNHIETCKECRTELEERQRLLHLIGEVELSAPACLKERVMRSIESEPQDAKLLVPKKKFFIPWGTIAAACAVVMIMIAGRGAIDVGGGDDIVEEGNMYRLSVSAPDKYSALEDAQAGGADPVEVYDLRAEANFDDAEIDEEVVVETTSSVLVLSPSVTDAAENAPLEPSNVSPLDDLLAAVMDDAQEVAILFAFESDAAGLAPDGAIDHFTQDDYTITRYTIDNEAEATFGGYIDLFEKKKLDYRAIIPNDARFDTCEIWLLEAEESDPA